MRQIILLLFQRSERSMSTEPKREDYERMLVIARSLIRQESNCTLTATGLVHELFMKLAKRSRRGLAPTAMGAFPEVSTFAARVMRQILVDRARHRLVRKKAEQFAIGGAKAKADNIPQKDLVARKMLDIDEALEMLQSQLPECAELARLRLYDGLTIEDAAIRMGISRATAFRKWAFCRSWIAAKLKSTDSA